MSKLEICRCEKRSGKNWDIDAPRVTRGHASFKYSSLYLGKRVTKLDSSVNGPAALSAGVKGSCFHLSKVSSSSQGLSFLCVEGMMKRRRD